MADAALTPRQRLRVAVAHYCDEVPQAVIASLMGVNQGRINEACVALWMASLDPKKATEIMRASGQLAEDAS